MLFYHFVLLSPLSIVGLQLSFSFFAVPYDRIFFQFTGINLDHMLCAAMSDPFQGANYRLFACCHQTLLCPLLSKGTVLLFGRPSRNDLCVGEAVPISGGLTDPALGAVHQYHQLTAADYPTQEEATEVLLRHRYNAQATGTTGVTLSHDVPELAIGAEYTMPTTKID